MEAVQSNTEKLIEGVNFYTKKNTSWNGIEWTSYNAKIGNTFFQCMSLEQLQEKISNYVFETEESKLKTAKAIKAFGTSA